MSLTKNEQEIIDYLNKVNVSISIKELANNLGKDLGNMSKNIKSLDEKKEITIRMIKDGKRHMKYIQVNDGKEREISNDNLSDKAKIVPKKPKKTIKIEKTTEKTIDKISTDNISDLKKEILNDLKEMLLNDSKIQEAKSEIIKIINTLPIREVDKKELGFKGKTSKEVRSYVIDLLNEMTVFKE